MKEKFGEKKIFKIAESGLMDLSCEQIKELIKNETEKDYDKIDTEFIDVCFELLEFKQQEKNTFDKNSRIKKSVLKNVFIYAAIISVFVVTTLTVSAYAFHFNIPEQISYLISNKANTDINLSFANSKANTHISDNSNSKLVNKIKKQGISQFTIPAELERNAEIECVKNISTDTSVSTDVEVKFKYNDIVGVLSISQFVDDINWSGESVSEDIVSAEMLNVNGMDVLLFERKNNCTIQYKDNYTVYRIYLTTNLKKAKEFARTIK